jgi:APA family basic amino acid/polyamine antiporter
MAEDSSVKETSSQLLQRQIGLAGATALGLGAILGTGVYVTLAETAHVHGVNVLVGIVIAAVVAICNGLSSAQLAANYPVSGGTYEYAYRLLHPTMAFLAGWLFLCAKSASAAAAALGAATYLHILVPDSQLVSHKWLALAILALIGGIAIAGIRLANWFNAILVVLSITALSLFVFRANTLTTLWPSSQLDYAALSGWGSLHAAAIMFVAFTGYGRIATLGEEVKQPSRTIPRAVIVTLMLTATIYWFVAVAVLNLLQYKISRSNDAQPIQLVSLVEGAFASWEIGLLTVGALSAFLAVETNLILGLSRVVLAMGRRGDLPLFLSHVHARTSSPRNALWLVVAIVAAIILLADFRVAWEFSALTVLVYYSITNACALRLPVAARMYPIWIPILGMALTACLTLFIDLWLWGTASGLLILGFLAVRLGRRSWNSAK